MNLEFGGALTAGWFESWRSSQRETAATAKDQIHSNERNTKPLSVLPTPSATVASACEVHDAYIARGSALEELEERLARKPAEAAWQIGR